MKIIIIKEKNRSRSLPMQVRQVVSLKKLQKANYSGIHWLDVELNNRPGSSQNQLPGNIGKIEITTENKGAVVVV